MMRVITENINPTLPEDQHIQIPFHLIDKSKYATADTNFYSLGEEDTR